MLSACSQILHKSLMSNHMVKHSHSKFTSIRDITVILNYIFANPSMKNGETWTPICIPGIKEEYILYVYMHYYT